MKSTIVILIFISIIFQVHAQKVITLDNIEILGFGKEYEIKYYQKENDTYTSINFGYNPTFNVPLPSYGSMQDKLELSKIKEINKGYTVHKKDIRKCQFTKLLPNIKHVITDSTTRHTFAYYNKHLFVHVTETYGKKTDKHDLGYLRTKKETDTIKKWRATKVDFLSYLVFDLGDEHYTVHFYDHIYQKGYLYPTKQGYTIEYIDFDFEKSTTKNIEIENQIFYKAKRFFSLKEEKGKYNLAAGYGEKVFPKDYDTIIFNPSFFVTKDDTTYTVFDSKLQKLPIENIKSLHFYSNESLQILQGNQLSLISKEGEKINPYQSHSIGVCGNETVYSYELKKNKKKKQCHTLIYTIDVLSKANNKKKEFFFKNFTNQYEFTFLDTTTKVYNIFSNYDLLITKKDSVYGLFSYANHDIKLDGRFAKKKRITLKEELPIQFDKIEYKDGLIYIRKNKLIGVYPHHKRERYLSLGERQGNYITFVLPSLKKGWLDLNTGKEYLN